MSDVQYPFIDVAVHDRVSEAFAAGMAVVLFSTDLRSVSWANGRGAALFGFGSIYDFLDQGLDRGELMYRQVEPVARSLQSVGDRRTFTVRIASGFLRVAVQARCEMIRVQNKSCILLSVPVDNQRLSLKECAARLIEGFDDPETHMAVLDAEGSILAASGQFSALSLSIQTTRMLVSMVGNDRHRLIKRPIATASGYLPAAIGQVSEEPALNLLFVVGATKTQAAAVTAVPAIEDATTASASPEVRGDEAETLNLPDFEDALSAVAAIEDNPDIEEEISLDDTSEAGFPDVSEPDETEFDETSLSETEEDVSDTDSDVATADEDIGSVTAADTNASEELQVSDYLPGDQAALPDEAEPVLESDTADEGDVTGPFPEQLFEEDPAEQEMIEEEEIATGTQQTSDGQEDLPAGSDEEGETVEGASVREDDGSEAAPVEASATTEAEPVAAAADDEADLAPSAVAQSARPLRTVRFVWKIDAGGRFSEVSKEFAEAVGPHAADISGMAFSDLAALFNLDPDGKITELLSRRDTWSGKTIWWPMEGTSQVVPVDLAALPTYTRAREFDGFRGFGIVRMGDAAEDPHAAGLSLGAAQEDQVAEPVEAEPSELTSEISNPRETAAEQPADNDVAEITVPANEDLSETDDVSLEEGDDERAEEEAGAEISVAANDDIPAAAETDERADAAEAEDQTDATEWPEGERPALTLVDTPGRRQSDKVIQLEGRRSRLSPGEQANFQEIARRLDTFVKSGDDAEDEGDKAAEDVAVIADQATSVSREDDAPSLAPDGEASARNESLVPDLDDVTEQSSPIDDDDIRQGDAEQSEDIQAADDDRDLEAANREETADDTVVPLHDDQSAEVSDDVPDDGDEEAHEPFDAAALAAMLPGRDRIGLSEEIIDQMPVALLVHAGEKLIHANGEFLTLTGYSSLDALADVGGLDALLQRQELEGKTSEAGGMVVVRADDVIVPVTARLQSIRFNDASALMLALMPVAAAEPEPQNDTTAQVLPLLPIRTADQLAKLQVEVEELRSILETATDGVVIIGSDREVRSMNRAASALFNFDGDEINGKPFVTLFAHESQRAIIDYLSGLSGHGVASVLNDGREVIGREASGGFIPLFMTIGRLTSSNGYCAVIRDITQWKRTEDELRTAKRAAETANAHKSEFLAHVSHEIRTPLNAIIGFADMMASERLGPVGHPRYIEYSNDIGRSGRHVLDIVNDLLDISKIEAGELDLDFIAVGLNETVSEAVSLVQPQANGQRVIIRTALSQAVPQVVADLRSIKQIVLNILSNAIRFTPSGGQIVVSTAYESNGTVVLRIRDTGIGMNRSELEMAMKPFRQVAGASRKRGDGTGLGLPLTKAMVDANRANFAITSAPNEGTLVEITFPPQRVLAS